MDFHMTKGIPLFDSLFPSSCLSFPSLLPCSGNGSRLPSRQSPQRTSLLFSSSSLSLLPSSLSLSFSVACTASAWRTPSYLCPVPQVGSLSSEWAETLGPSSLAAQTQAFGRGVAGGWRWPFSEVYRPFMAVFNGNQGWVSDQHTLLFKMVSSIHDESS